MSRARIVRTRKQPAGLVLGIGAFETISAVEGIRLTDEMRRDLLAVERQGMSSGERTRFITEKYGRKPA